MHLLVTRPIDEAKTMKSALERLGHHVTVQPLLDIEFERIEPRDLTGAQALLFTSRNALKSLELSTALAPARLLPAYVVGPGTAALAHKLGFRNVITGPGSADALTALIVKDASPSSGPIVHLAGAHLAYDSKAALEGHGFEVRLKTAYRAIPTSALLPNVVSALAAGSIEGAMFSSPRSAKVFVELVTKRGLNHEAGVLHYFCLSPAVARAFDGLNPDKISVAAKPNSQEMLALVARIAAQY